MITVNTITEKLSLPKFDLPQFDVSRAADFARDAAYVGVGAVVVSVQTLDERRRTVTEQVVGQVRKIAGTTD